METWKVACLDVWDENVRKIVRDLAPVNFGIHFAASYNAEVQYDLAVGGDFIMTGWAPVTARMIEDAPRLRMIHKWGVGYDKIDVTAAQKRGIPVAIAAGANASPVAEHAIALMLAVYRRIPFVDRSLREGVWLKQEMRSVCHQLKGKTIGLLGLGHIGREVARKLTGFEVNIIYYDVRRADQAVERDLAVTFVPYDQFLVQADILSIHVPLLEGTRDLVNADAISRMKDGAVIINTSRGGVVDEQALCHALQTGRLFGAGLDTHTVEPPPADNPIFALNQVVVTPHTGAVVVDNIANVTLHVFENMQRLLRGETISMEDLVA